ncbi:hypothetical protein RZS08_50505, partial [Arthrospira platensis SPKY1]|nr:hypothetical protein [Arthrospira platensis SPKY1]
PIRRSLFSSRYELFNADFDGSMDGFTSAGSLGFVPANQSWGLGTSSPGPGRDFTFLTAGSRSSTDTSDFLLSPMVRLPAGETLLFTARIGLASEHLSIGLTKTPSRNDIEHIIRLGDAPVVNNARQVEFVAPETDDYYVIFYQTGGLANQTMTLDKVVLARRALPVIRITSLQADEELLESQPVTLVARAFAFG